MSEWISVEDRLPEVGSLVRFKAEIWRYGKNMGTKEKSGIFDGIGYGDYADYDDHYENVTHWMPTDTKPQS